MQRVRQSTYLFAARALRDFGDGFVAILLPVYLLVLGFSPLQVGVLATASLFGSALLTIAVGILGARHDLRRLLLAAACLMVATGGAMSVVTDYALLLVVACAGTINPSTGSVSVFVPLEHAVLARNAGDRDRTTVFARYSLVGALASAVGALAAALPDARAFAGLGQLTAIKLMFVLYAIVGVAGTLLYSRIPARPPNREAKDVGAGLGPSRAIVLKLAALFSLDAFAGGFVVQSLLALWLFERFNLSLSEAGVFFFWTGLLSAFSFPGRSMAVETDRADQHHGVHPHPLKHRADAGGRCTDLASGSDSADDPRRPVTDGRSHALLLCDGGGDGGGTGRGRKLYLRAAQLGRRGEPGAGRCAVCRILSRLAAPYLRVTEDRLRPALAAAIPASQTAGGALKETCGPSGDGRALTRRHRNSPRPVREQVADCTAPSFGTR